MRAIVVSLSISGMAFFAFGQPKTALAEDSLALYEDVDAYQVYSAALRGRAPVGIPLLIERRTAPGDNCIAPSGAHSAQVREASEDSRETNRRQLRLVERFEIPVKLLNDAAARDIQSKLAGRHEPELRRVGLTSLSAVGFSKDRSVAVLYVGNYCGLTCGQWRSAAYIKKNGAWTELKGQVVCMAMS